MRIIRNFEKKECYSFLLFLIAVVSIVLFLSCSDEPENNTEIRQRLLLLGSEAEMLEEKLEQLEDQLEELIRPPDAEIEIIKLEEEKESLEKQLDECLKQKIEAMN